MTPEHTLSPDAKVPEVVTWLRAEAMRHAGRRGTKTATDALGIAASVLENAAGVSGPLDDEDDENDACSPACFDDCDGSDEDNHVPAGTYDPNLSYGVNGR